MALQTEVVYPSVASYSGAAQLNLGPFPSGVINRLLRAEVRGQLNWQSATVTPPAMIVNYPLWALQWVTGGAAPADCITTADGPAWLMREQIASDPGRAAWVTPTSPAAFLASNVFRADWAGQLAIGADTQLWLSFQAPTGAAMPAFNVYASIRWWWV